MARRDSRTLILEAARAEFGARGFDGARVARIALRAAVNKQLIFYYFGSKSGLHRAVTGEAAARVDLDTTGAGTATENVRRVCDALHDSLRARPELIATFVEPPGEGVIERNPTLHELEQRLAAVISEGQGLGYFRDDTDPGLVARQGVVLCVGFLALRHRLNDPDWEAWKREVGETLVRRLAW